MAQPDPNATTGETAAAALVVQVKAASFRLTLTSSIIKCDRNHRRHNKKEAFSQCYYCYYYYCDSFTIPFDWFTWWPPFDGCQSYHLNTSEPIDWIVLAEWGWSGLLACLVGFPFLSRRSAAASAGAAAAPPTVQFVASV